MLIKLLKELIKSQKEINESLKNIRKDLEPKLEDIRLNAKTLTSTNITVDRLENYVETNIYSKEQTVEAINKEITYRQDYEVWKEEGSDLVDLVEKYCKYKDKYEAIDLFKEIDKEYEIKKRK